MRKQPVGSAERAVLAGLRAGGGYWTSKDRPLWESRYWTIQLLNGLASKGLVVEVNPGVRYELSTDGRNL